MSTFNAPLPAPGLSSATYVDLREGMCFQDEQGRWWKFNTGQFGRKVWVAVENPPTCSRSDVPFESVR